MFKCAKESIRKAFRISSAPDALDTHTLQPSIKQTQHRHHESIEIISSSANKQHLGALIHYLAVFACLCTTHNEEGSGSCSANNIKNHIH
eukprot:scaffold24727_cov67-Skeletonema_dohrnii-CCMP3373.AAC.2